MHQGIEPTEAGNGKLDDATACGGVFEVLITGGGSPAGLGYLRDDCIRNRWIETATVLGHAGIMDHHGAAASGDKARVGRTETTPCAGYDDDLTVKADRGQGCTSSLCSKLIQRGGHGFRLGEHRIMPAAQLATIPARLARSHHQTIIEVRLGCLNESAPQCGCLPRAKLHR